MLIISMKHVGSWIQMQNDPDAERMRFLTQQLSEKTSVCTANQITSRDIDNCMRQSLSPMLVIGGERASDLTYPSDTSIF